ncbi:MAG: hypothetical protein ACTS2F_07550 [Thainema sp.]
MKPLPLISSLLALSLSIGTPATLAHVGHGDEFQATGGVNRVEVNMETDSLLGIQVSPIEFAVDGSNAVLIPVTALVDDNGRQLVFVQYEGYYEPVDVVTGATQGDLIEVVEGLSVGENLVTQGSLSLYAESRKTQTAEAAPDAAENAESAESAAAPITDEAHAQADAEGIPHSHDAEGNFVQTEDTANSDLAQQPTETAESSAAGFPMGKVAIAGGGILAIFAVLVMMTGRKKHSTFSNKRGGL